MNFSIPKLDSAVQDFKNLFTNHKELYLYGQFYLHNRYFDQLIAEIKIALQGTPYFMFNPNPNLLDNTLKLIKDFLRLPANQLTEQTINDYFKMLDPTGSFTSSLKQILLPGPPDLNAVKQDYAMIWSSSQIGSGLPWLTSSFRKYLASYNFEKDKCFDTVRSLSRKLLNARGITKIPSNAKISDGAIAQTSLKKSFKDPGSGVISDVIVYQAPAVFSILLPKIKMAIDAKCVVQCGVLSGVFAPSSFPNPEHYILIFGYDTFDGKDVFLFWDPDAVRSNIGSTIWGRGFGCLFFQSKRFSTAIDNTDFFNIQIDAQSDFFGDHLSEPRRHRYQAYSLQTRPL
ncbi:hypothetical protein AT278_29745 [Bacillus cereus]|uniref:hypothetical protein n=1 Tax=Bacillus TaxID=1386 RepID=UPI00077A8BFA|nr:hypothetical protein [Bacillus cereus]KXY57734.1 hypothetical protein AT278_29745 [Bacillus cereus]PFJ90138.1 hypothetical protein COJ11_21990 [Bacillus cereus]PGR54795.1 hypothetical protein COC44_28675 [Bacillus cereus]